MISDVSQGSFRLNCTYPKHNPFGLHCHLFAGFAGGSHCCKKIEVITVLWLVHHSCDLEHLKCELDEDGIGYTMVESISLFIFLDNTTIETLYDSKLA